MINSVVLVGLISSEIFYNKKENKNNEIKFITFKLILEENLIFKSNKKEKNELLIKTYDFFFRNFKDRDYKNTFLALKGRILNKNNSFLIFADKIHFLGKKS